MPVLTKKAAVRANTLRMLVLSLILSLMTPSLVTAATVEERPTGMAMIADVLLIRPVMAVGTGIGAGVYLVTLPFSLLGGNAQEAGSKLVVVPFRASFLRCLGCTNKHTDN